MKTIKRRDLKLQPIDLFTVAIKDQVRLQIGFTIRTTGKLDIGRLKEAVDKTLLSVPLFGCRFDAEKLRFVEAGFRADDLVILHSEPASQEREPWLDEEPQLMAIHVYDDGKGQILKFCIDHILGDGRGFTEYLYLLCALYNDPEASGAVKNYRDMYRETSHFSGIRRNEQSRGLARTFSDIDSIPRPEGFFPHVEGGTPVPNVCTIELSEEQVARLKQKGKTVGATLNDLFLAAWFATIFEMSDKNESRIDLPVDIRPFFEKYLRGKMTITNFSSIYVVYAKREDATSFDSMIQSVAGTMRERKESSAFFGILKLLYLTSGIIPLRHMKKILARKAELLPEMYSNLGVVDHRRLIFEGTEVTGIYLTSMFLSAPNIQVLVSSFKGTTTLIVNRYCSPENRETGMQALRTMKRILLNWIEK